MDEINVQVKFTREEEGYPRFQDALYIPLEKFSTLSDQAIEDLKTDRFEAFKHTIDNPPAPAPAPTLQQQATTLEQQIAALTAALDVVNIQIEQQ